jgi:NADH-quinone oxidoreductase subunit C
MAGNLVKEEFKEIIAREWDIKTLEVIPDPFITKLKVEASDLLTLIINLKLRNFTLCNLLLDLIAVDYKDHYQLVYIFYSTKYKHRVSVVCDVPKEEARAASIHNIYDAADVLEREVFDLMGIEFVGHPNLQRILLADDFVGHPLRKDYQAGSGRTANA